MQHRRPALEASAGSRLGAAKPNRAFRRQELLDALPERSVNLRTVDAHVKNLRQRLGACAGMLETVRGVGYRPRG